MGKRYKNWTEALANQMMVLYRVGKETGGEKFMERLKEEYFRIGRNSARSSLGITGTTPEHFADCSGGLRKICDLIDNSMANFWNGYVENTATAFEKEVKTDGFSKLLVKGDACCRYRIELDDQLAQETRT
jgi:hypothetical protein